MASKTIAALFLFVCPVLAQQAFEVASVREAAPITDKASAEAKSRYGMQVNGAQVDIGMMSLAELVQQAYSLKPYQVSGPDWMASARFDIHAKLPAGATPDQAPAMLQTLLAERFKLTFHRESKEHQVYGMVVAKGGLKVKEAGPDSGSTAGPLKLTSSGGQLHVDQDATMAGVSAFFSRFVDQPLVDMTGLSGAYRVQLDFPAMEFKRMAEAASLARSGMPADVASDPASGVTLNSALQQLGLKLEPRKAPVEVLIVDHAEKVPTEN